MADMKTICGLAFAAALAMSITLPARAADKAESAADPVVEAATLRCLGTYWIIRGDDNANARIEVSYRKTGTAEWKPGPNLFRVEKGANKDKLIKLPADAWLFA